MAQVLMAWELGSGMGHIDRMLVGARALRQRGHTVRFALKDLSRAHGRVAAEGFAIMQSPVWLPQLANPPRLGNYAAVLASAGWLNPSGLAGLVLGWRSLFAMSQPDVLVCDHAPTAMLAARGTGLAVCAVGNSFEVPPAAACFPPMAFWEPTEAARCPQYDATLLAPTNEALALLGDAPLRSLPDIFAGTAKGIVSLPDVTHYQNYPLDATMVGPAYVADIGLAPRWPSGPGPKVFVYLSPTNGEFEKVIAALKGLAMVSLVFARGLSPDAAKRLGGPQMQFETSAIRMDAVLHEADVVVSHASIGTVSAAAMAGTPQLGIPQHMEQMMVGRRMQESGIGLVVPLGKHDQDYRALLKQLATGPHFRAQAEAVALRNQGHSPAQTGERIADLVEAAMLNRS